MMYGFAKNADISGEFFEDLELGKSRLAVKINKKPAITIDLKVNGKHNAYNALAAIAIAKALKAHKLVYVSDVPGLLRDADDPSSVMASLKVDQVNSLVQKKIISGGMLPKVESGVDALRAGVKKIHMIDGRLSHSLLLEIFTDKGVGTEIVV